jgi:hypothetical protein
MLLDLLPLPGVMSEHRQVIHVYASIGIQINYRLKSRFNYRMLLGSGAA